MSITTPHAPIPIPRQRIVDVDWTLDVLLASGELASVGVPIISLSITVNNGNSDSNNNNNDNNSEDNNNNNTVLQYRLTVQEFHQWRFTMAKVVRDLIYLEKKDALATRIETTETLGKSLPS